jgi:hypothetical protein
MAVKKKLVLRNFRVQWAKKFDNHCYSVYRLDDMGSIPGVTTQNTQH